MKLRAKTLAELRETLDRSYFTADSFQVKTVPDGSPFLEIEFVPARHFFYRLYSTGGEVIRTEEAPGKLITTAEEKLYENLESALEAIRLWTQRIREEYAHAATLRSEVDEFLEQFRAQVFATKEGEDPSEAFSVEEIGELRDKLDKLMELVTAQAEELKANSYQVREFQREMDKIKADLNGMPRGVWKSVASNKLLKSVKNFLGTAEGRTLIADGLKKLIGM